MNHFHIRFCLALCLFLPLAHSATAKPADNTELQVFKVQTEAKIEAAKENQQKDLQLHQQLVTSQNERIEQINHQVDWLGNLIALGSLIITLLMVVIGYFAYGKAKSDAENIAKTVAKDEANTTSKAEVKKWFGDNLAEVNNEINALKDRLSQLTKEVDAHAEQVHQNIDKTNSDLQTHASKIIASNPLSTDAKSALTETDKQTLVEANTSLQNKPESQYTFDDWDTRAFAAYAESNFPLAAEYWKNAARVPRATDTQVAQVLYNQGVALGLQNKPDEAIACYQQVIQRFGDSTLPALQAHVANALVNQGVELRQLNKPDEAIACYQQVIQRVGASALPDLQVQVANALFNQGGVLGRQNKPDEAIACYQQVIQRYGDSALPELQERVAGALNGHGFAQLIKAKQAWSNQAARTELLTESLNLFERAAEKAQNKIDKAVVLGNLSYALWLLGRDAEVETPLREALTLGGEKTFNDEIEDTKISTVPPDSGFEQLVTRLWNGINSNK